jgi:hypothetical protein
MDELKHRVFDLITEKIFERIQVANEKHPAKHIFLCGRMSRSLYLQQRLQTKYKNIIVVSDEKSPAAHGAVYHGFSEKLSIQRFAPIAFSKEKITKTIDSSYYDFNHDQYTHVVGLGNIQILKNMTEPVTLFLQISVQISPSGAFFQRRTRPMHSSRM